MAEPRKIIKPCDHCETKVEKRKVRTIRGKRVLICDPCYMVLTAEHRKATENPVVQPSSVKSSRLQWTQTTMHGNIVHRITHNGVTWEAHELVEFRHGRDRPPTRHYFLTLGPGKPREWGTLSEIEKEMLNK